MIFELFFGFLKVGCFAFGGAYAAIPLIRDVVLSHGWITDEVLSYMIAVSESTPGPVMLNLATYIGSNQAGFLGSVVATSAIVLPAFLIVILIMKFFSSALENKYVQAVLSGLKPAVIGIIIAVGAYMIIDTCLPEMKMDYGQIIISVAVAAIMIIAKKCFKKKLSPITLIGIAAVLGIAIYGV